MLGRDPVKLLLATSLQPTLDLERTFLRRHEVRILEATRPRTVIDIARRERPQIAVVDLADPGVEALDLCHVLKAAVTTRRIAVILLVDPADRDRAATIGADVAVAKPLDRDEFLRAVRRFVRLRERRFPRFPLNLRFSLEHRGRRGQAFSRELSANGALIKTDWDLPPGARIAIRFRLPGDGDEIRCAGVVRHRLAFGSHPMAPALGLEFVEVAPADQRRFDDYIEHQRSDAHSVPHSF